MKIVSIIFVIYLLRYAHLKPVSEAVAWIFPDLPCVKGIESISTIAYNRQTPQGVPNVREQDTCNYIGSNKKVVFIVHGFISSPNTTIFYDLATQLVKNDYTVFSVNWTEGACTNQLPVYLSAANNTKKVGELMADYIKHVTTTCKVPLENIILIGHSLGAHVSGFAAKKVKALGLGTISRLFGADPAGPWFSSYECGNRLCVTDAKHVTVLHTTTLYGIHLPIGHLNLYFNDASKQPGCGLDLSRTCSHSNAIVYLTELLEKIDCGFPGVFKLEKFDQSQRPTNKSIDCIFVDKRIFERPNISPGEYTVFVNEPPFCSPKNDFTKCQQ